MKTRLVLSGRLYMEVIMPNGSKYGFLPLTEAEDFHVDIDGHPETAFAKLEEDLVCQYLEELRRKIRSMREMGRDNMREAESLESLLGGPKNVHND